VASAPKYCASALSFGSTPPSGNPLVLTQNHLPDRLRLNQPIAHDLSQPPASSGLRHRQVRARATPASCLLRPLAPAYLSPPGVMVPGPARVMHVYLFSLSRLPCASFSPTFPARLLPLALLQQHHHPRPAPFGPDSSCRCCVWQTCMLRPPQAPPFEHARRCTTPLLHARPNPYCMPLSYCAQSSFPLNSTACLPAPCVYAVLYSGSSSRRLTGQPRLGRKTLRLHLGPLSEGSQRGR
jgi:hypothetical protein